MDGMKNVDVSTATWKVVNSRKEPGQSMSDVVRLQLGDDLEERDREKITMQLEDEVHKRVMEMKKEGESIDDTIQRIFW